MLAIERAGEKGCGLEGIELIPHGEKTEVAAENAGLGAGEPSSEIVRQSTADGVALLYQSGMRSFSHRLTCSRTGRVQQTWSNFIPIHPSVYLLWVHLITTDFKYELGFVNFDELPSLSFSNNGYHLL